MIDTAGQNNNVVNHIQSYITITIQKQDLYSICIKLK